MAKSKGEEQTIGKSDVATLAVEGMLETQPRVMPAITQLTPAAVVGVSTQLSIAQELLPEEFRGVELEVIETGFSPTVKWLKEGNYIAGQYISHEDGIGPNKSRLYNFMTKGQKRFGVWGTTVLDRAFDEGLKLGQIASGRMLMITYMGSVETDKEPCKLFHIAIAKTKSA